MSIVAQYTDVKRELHAAAGMAYMMDLAQGRSRGKGSSRGTGRTCVIKRQSQSSTGATSLTPLGIFRCESSTVWPKLRPLMSTSIVAGMASPGHKHSTVRRIK